jgi:hypothetical protein
MAFTNKILSKLLEFRDANSGAATVEFVLIFPMVLWLVFSTFELGWITTRQMMLARGLNLTIRDLRLDKIEDPTHDKLKQLVCERSLVLRNCLTSVHIELVPLSLASGIPQTASTCVDRAGEIEPVENFSAGVAEDIMFVRACVIVDLMLPGMGIGAQLTKDSTGGYAMYASSAFKREP